MNKNDSVKIFFRYIENDEKHALKQCFELITLMINDINIVKNKFILDFVIRPNGIYIMNYLWVMARTSLSLNVMLRI
jgi:hypothetical protein